MLRPRLANCLAFFFVALSASAAVAQLRPQSPLVVLPKNRITSFIDDMNRVALPGNRHPLARPQYELGAVDPAHRMDRMILVLKPDSSQQAALEQLLYQQHNPQSPSYQQWLTPEDFGQRFGASESDVAQIENWLEMHGMTMKEVALSRRSVVFSGTAAQVESAFHTSLRRYNVAGNLHVANATDPEIPRALAGVVSGLVSLHDFPTTPQHSVVAKTSPAFSASSSHYLTPADFATIYNVNPLYQQAVDGTGQSIAIVGRTNINLNDVRLFRKSFGLPANDPQIIVNGPDPGIVSLDEQVEANLDVQWAGAVARNAAVKFVVSASTRASDGTYLSAQYIVNRNLAPVMSLSFGLCESAIGASGNSFLNSLWQQAAAQGITVLVASGDSGAAGCDSSSVTKAKSGTAVNGLCSTPHSVCVGGTQFNDIANPGAYWSSTNAPGTQASALSYIPETVWNESGPSGLWSSGGGASIVYGKPFWQSGADVPSDKKRDVPDVSLAAASHDGYMVYMNGGLYIVGGTSAAAPAFAGLMALVVQGNRARQGNANTVLYPLAGLQKSGGAAVFHDVTTGSNSVPGVNGFKAGAGYDQATGLGSVDANLLVTHWTDRPAVPGLQLTLSSPSLSLAAGTNSTVNLSANVSGGFTSLVSLSVSGLPSGVTATFTPASLPAPGSGSGILKLGATTKSIAGTYSVTIKASGGGLAKSVSLAVILTPAPTFTLAAAQTQLTLPANKSTSVGLTLAGNTSFKSAVSLTASGMPTGMTASFSPPAVAAPGSGTSTMILSSTRRLATGTYSLTITAAGGGVSQSLLVKVKCQ